MESDQGICRVCRSGPTLLQPLFHPCKCSGSIRFVHQDCLNNWLSHSRTKYCELCEHPFVFTPIYRQDMPCRIPMRVILKQSMVKVFGGIVKTVRSLLVLTVWLVLLPTTTYWTWQFYFWSGNNIGFTSKPLNQTTILRDENNTFPWNYSMKEFISDCIQGQIITVVVIIVFVAAYLFREWVIQNTQRKIEESNETIETNHQENNRSQIQVRLEQLRRELEQRRMNESVNNDTLEYNNPYANTRQYIFNQDDEDDFNFNMKPASGTQSPFASWRDYQQQDAGPSQLKQEVSANEQPPKTWKASEFNNVRPVNIERAEIDYFSEQVLDGAMLEEEEEDTPLAIASPVIQENVVENDAEEVFDFMENLDNILEAIGMRGSLFTLLQNSILMALMINLCLCVTVWIPYVIGRSVILVRPISIIDKPIYMFQRLSNPLIDFVLDNIITPTYNNFETICGHILPTSVLIAIKTLYTDTQSGIYYIVKSIHITLHDNGGGSLAQLLSETTSTIIDRTNTFNNWELIKGYLYSISAMIMKRWRQCATDNGNVDRVVCTVVGYCVLISIGSWFLSKTKRTRAGSTNEILRQQAVFLKVLFFIFLELVIFPTVCGVLLDISTLPLFTEVSIKSRFHFVLLNPYSGVFLHWFVGTGFIFQFSVFIALVREVVRPGVLFFIRDPNDPQFHPVQDMVDQPMLVLLWNLFSNGAAYFMLIMVGMGFVTFLVSRLGGIYPIIWKFNAPIVPLPIDLLFIQFLLPPIVKYIVPREFSKKSVITWWHIVSRQLRLSSYMFGGRYPDEEGDFDINKKDGSLVQVPKHDNVPIVVPRRRMIVPLDPVTLQPRLEAERHLSHPAISPSGNESRDTTIVYIPPYFYTRLGVFLFLIWTTGSIVTCSVSVVPLKFGRNLFAKLNLGSDRPIHDLYSFILGAYIMIVMSSLINSVVTKYNVIKDDQGRVYWSSVKDYIMEKVRNGFKSWYVFVVFGIIVPFLTGVILDLYAFMPIRHSRLDEKALEIYLTMDWAMGVAVVSVFYGVVKCIPGHEEFREAVTQFSWRNLDSLDISYTTKHTVIPILVGLCTIIILPALLTLGVIVLFNVDDAAVKVLIFRCAYPVLLCLVCFGLFVYGCIHLSKIWMRSVRDDTYMIGNQLHNLNE